MDTMTSTATKIVSGTKLFIATMAMLGAGSVALATVPLNSPYSGAVDPDAQTTYDVNQLFVQSTTTYKSGSKADYCYTFPSTGKTYLMEGISNNGNFATWQKNCAELNLGKTGVDYQCVNGACVNKAPALPDLIVKDFSFTTSTNGDRESKLVSITIKNIGNAVAKNTSASSSAVIWVQSYGIKSDGSTTMGSGYGSDIVGVSELQPGQEVQFSYPEHIPSSGLAGSKQVKMVVDNLFGDTFIKESNEANNSLIKTVDLTIVSTTPCTDTDGGKNYDVKGTIKGILSDGTPDQTDDYCSNDKVLGTRSATGSYLSEYSCLSGGYFTRYWFDCNCKDGACVAPTSTQKTLTIVNHKADGQLTFGSNVLLASYAITAGGGDIQIKDIAFDKISNLATGTFSNWVLKEGDLVIASKGVENSYTGQVKFSDISDFVIEFPVNIKTIDLYAAVVPSVPSTTPDYVYVKNSIQKATNINAVSVETNEPVIFKNNFPLAGSYLHYER